MFNQNSIRKLKIFTGENLIFYFAFRKYVQYNNFKGYDKNFNNKAGKYGNMKNGNKKAGLPGGDSVISEGQEIAEVKAIREKLSEMHSDIKKVMEFTSSCAWKLLLKIQDRSTQTLFSATSSRI